MFLNLETQKLIYSKVIIGLCKLNDTDDDILTFLIRERELISEDIFNRAQSIRYWDNIHANTARLKFDTKLMYFQYRLVRHQLHTNVIRNKFDPTQRPHCSLCEDASETKEHLMRENVTRTVTVTD